MKFSHIPIVDDLDELTPQERRSIMAVYEGKDARAEIEEKVRNVFLWAALNQASDVHIVGKFDRITPVVTVSVRAIEGLIHEVYRGEHGKYFENKLFQLTGTPQGGSTPQIVSSRFEMNLPLHYAIKHGLKPRSSDTKYAVNIRLEYTKTFDGFSIVCRLLDQQKTPELHELGFTGAMMHALLGVLKEPRGLILVSGPTGSGKTTLLNACMNYLNDGTKAISTAEDPVEYRLGDGSIKQMQIGGDITFPRALRSILRQDPDIILIGEIRDAETMEIAIQAAQTGHLVLSTIHSNSAHETVGRALSLCQDKERDAVRLAETLKFVIAQRLINRYEGELLPRPLTRNEIDWMVMNGIPQPSNFIEVVPEHKNGKMAVVEAIAITDEIKMVMRSGLSNNEEVYRLARKQGQYESLASAGVRGVESKGCLLKDCMESLDTNTDAKAYPGARLVAAWEYDLSLSVVSHLVDQRVKERESGEHVMKRVMDGKPVDLFSQLERRKKQRDNLLPQVEKLISEDTGHENAGNETIASK
jgi:type II secretory ATPase GspE/PulE/Tfp pilus assembly ATPase PilB-like protein